MTSEAGRTEYVPSQEAKDLYAKHVAQAWTDQQASTDAFDNNLLTFSSAALGLSVAFIKDIVPLEHAEWLKTLYISWTAFSVCILVTISSFQIAARAQYAHSKILADYYLRGDVAALDRKSGWAKLLPFCSAVGAACLLFGIVSTLLFASQNLTHNKETKAWQTTTKQKNQT